MSIGPFSSYAPPGTYTSTVMEPDAGATVGGIRIPVFIGTAQESISQSNVEIVRGSSSVADTPIFNEDVTNRWVVQGQTLTSQDGNLVKFKVRNLPIVDGSGQGKTAYDSSKVSVLVDGQQVVVSSVDGQNGFVTLLVPPDADSHVVVNYFFHRKDTSVIDDVSNQVTSGQAVLTTPKSEPFVVNSDVSDTLVITVNDSSTYTIKLTSSNASFAVNVADDINSNSIPGLLAVVDSDANGLNHVKLVAPGNIRIGSGNANGALGFNPGDNTNRNKSFRVFNGPIVDGSDGGITTTNPSKVTVLVNGTQVIPVSVDGLNQEVVLAVAPSDGSTVTVQYYFNTFQDTFDYLPNSNITSVSSVGISPGRNDYQSNTDFTVVNDGDQSKVQWGTSFQVVAGQKTGATALDSTQIVGTLADEKVYGVLCDRFVDSSTFSASTTKFSLPLSPRTGNGRDTPLNQSLYQTVSNGRVNLPTNRPDLITVYVGKNWRDAASKPPVTVVGVDSVTNTVTLKDPVKADYNVYATFYYNRISDDKFTVNVLTPGASGLGQYSVTSSATGQLSSVNFGSKSGFSQTLQWPTGSEFNPGAFHTGDGTPVSETVTVTFDASITPATHASFSNSKPETYDIYESTKNFGGVSIDNSPPFSVDLSQPFVAVLVGQPISSATSFLSTDKLVLSIDGVSLAPISLSGVTSAADAVTAINAAIDADTTVHADGSATFASSTPNGLATATSYGSQVVISISGRNIPSSTNGLVSNVSVKNPTAAGQTDASAKLGFTSAFKNADGSFNALNKPAMVVGSKTAPFSISDGINDSILMNVDGTDVGLVLDPGNAVTLSDVINAVNVAYTTAITGVAPVIGVDVAATTTDIVALANDIRTKYVAHYSDDYDGGSGRLHNGVNYTLTAPSATNLASAITLINDLKDKLGTHVTSSYVHKTSGSVGNTLRNSSDATDLTSARSLINLIRVTYNDHLIDVNMHGDGDSVNVVTAANATDAATSVTLANAIKTAYEAHRVRLVSHIAADIDDNITSANATNYATTLTLATELMNKLNAHFIHSSHPASDTDNTISSGVINDQNDLNILLNAIKTSYNAHRIAIVNTNYVHGNNDVARTETLPDAPLYMNADVLEIASAGAGINAGKLVITSMTNTVNSSVTFKPQSKAAGVLGFTSATYSRTQPTASMIVNALNADSTFNPLGVARTVSSPSGKFVSIDSRSVGYASTIAFTSVSNSAFSPWTGLGIMAGSSGDVGEAAVSGFIVTSSAGNNGSHGVGIPGQTYTDATTGLRFSLLKPVAGNYQSGGKFTLLVSPTFTADANVPTKAVPGVNLTVYNTVNTNQGTTAVVSTNAKTGSEPKVGDVYYVSYNFAKSDLSTQLFRDKRKIQAAFGPPTPEYPLSLAAHLALLNGAVLVGLKQVKKTVGSDSASSSDYINAIDEQTTPMPGNIKPDTITPLNADGMVLSFLNQHCIVSGSPTQQSERVGFVGCKSGTTPLSAQTLAKSLNSELMVLAYPDSVVMSITDNNTGDVVDRLVDGFYLAVALAASSCSPSTDVATPMTRRQVLGIKALGKTLDPVIANQTAVAGVTVFETVNASVIRVRHALTTRPESVLTRTPSVTLIIHYCAQLTRNTIDPFIGQKVSSNLIGTIDSKLKSAFNKTVENKIVAAVAGVSVALDAADQTILRSETVYSPVLPLEYVVSTLSVRMSA